MRREAVKKLLRLRGRVYCASSDSTASWSVLARERVYGERNRSGHLFICWSQRSRLPLDGCRTPGGRV